MKKALTSAFIALFLVCVLLMSLSSAGTKVTYLGDVDKDGIITPSDARLVLRMSVGLEDLIKIDGGNSEPVSVPSENEFIKQGDCASEVEVIKDYSLQQYGTNYHFIIIKNNSKNPLIISTQSLCYGSDNSLLGSSESNQVTCLNTGSFTIFVESFDIKGTADHYKTFISSTKSDDDNYSTKPYLSHTFEKINNGAVCYVENISSVDVSAVEGIVLFISDGEAVGYDWDYFIGYDYLLHPGQTVFKQMNCFEDFDEIEFYVMGVPEIY